MAPGSEPRCNISLLSLELLSSNEDAVLIFRSFVRCEVLNLAEKCMRLLRVLCDRGHKYSNDNVKATEHSLWKFVVARLAVISRQQREHVNV
jgi:hypothetical protein